jgi:hypothetical protein
MRFKIAVVAMALTILAATAATAQQSPANEIVGAGSGETRDKSCAAARADAVSKAGSKKLSYPAGCTCTHKGALFSCTVRGVPQ